MTVSTRVLMMALASSLTLTSVIVTAFQNQPPPGKVQYERVCAGCHGLDAKGDVGPTLVPMILDYEELLARVRQGGGEMPAISKTTLSDEQVKQVLEYLKSL